MQRAKSDLSAKEYRNIDSKYRNQLLELKTAEMAASDLAEYHKVRGCNLCTALLRSYHAHAIVRGSCHVPTLSQRQGGR